MLYNLNDKHFTIDTIVKTLLGAVDEELDSFSTLLSLKCNCINYKVM